MNKPSITSMEQITAIKGFLKQNMALGEKSVEQIRKEELITASKLPALPGITTEKVNIGKLPGEWVMADNVEKDSKKLILYFHGGTFISGSCDSHRDLASRISKASSTKVLLIEYRLAPEHMYPAANEDCLYAYKWLIENGFSEKDIILGGESIGGYLVLTTLLKLRDTAVPLPSAAFLLSPHTDFLYYDGESYETRGSLDPMSTLEGAKKCAAYYFDPSIKDVSILSPLNEDLKGLPSLFIQVGDHEVILSDSTRLTERAKEAGVDVTLEVWDNMWHIFRFMAAMLPEGEQAINSIGEFVKRKFTNS